MIIGSMSANLWSPEMKALGPKQLTWTFSHSTRAQEYKVAYYLPYLWSVHQTNTGAV